MNGVKLLTAVGVSMCALGLAVAQPGAGRGGEGFGPGGPGHHGAPGAPGSEHPDLFEHLDTNGDGLISQDEVDAARAQREERLAERAQRMAARTLERFDANEDGVLDEAELTEMFASRPPRQGHRPGGPDGPDGPGGRMGHASRVLGPEAMKEFDTDGDGKVSRQEAQLAREQIAAKMEAKRAELVKEFDLDGDGELNEAERQTLRSEMRAKHRVGRADLDKDGVLDASELKAALELITDEDPRADFNGDGVVNQADYETLVNLLPGA